MTKSQGTSKAGERKYMAVAPQIVGTPADWDYSFSFTDMKHLTLRSAESEGLDYFGHDDFFLAEFEGDRCVAVVMGDKRHTEKSKQFGDYVIGINENLGI